MKYLAILISNIVIAAALSMSASAAPVSWTDWISSPDSFSAEGELTVGATTVDVSYSGTGAHNFVQTGVGTNYWSGTAYTNGAVDNAPPAAELVALNQGGIVTITFSETIINPFIAMNSWNRNIVDFGEQILVDSFGSGFWGNGTAIINGAGTGFSGSGEFHGVISLLGAFDSISFSHTTENWHGFTIGVAGLAPPTNDVPEPAPLALLGFGLLGLGLMRKRKT